MSWTAGAHVYSGRPDPEWQPASDVVAALLALWDQLDEATVPADSAPPLGYRGCYLRQVTGPMWRAYGTRVMMSGAGASITRADPEQAFERRLLRSAPPGLLPPGVVP